MPIQKWIERVGYAVVAGNNSKCAIAVSSVIALRSFLQSHYDPKKHEVALLVRFSGSAYYYYCEDLESVPFRDIYDPTTGKLLIHFYDVQKEFKGQATVVIRGEH